MLKGTTLHIHCSTICCPCEQTQTHTETHSMCPHNLSTPNTQTNTNGTTCCHASISWNEAANALLLVEKTEMPGMSTTLLVLVGIDNDENRVTASSKMVKVLSRLHSNSQTVVPHSMHQGCHGTLAMAQVPVPTPQLLPCAKRACIHKICMAALMSRGRGSKCEVQHACPRACV